MEPLIFLYLDGVVEEFARFGRRRPADHLRDGDGHRLGPGRLRQAMHVLKVPRHGDGVKVQAFHKEMHRGEDNGRVAVYGKGM